MREESKNLLKDYLFQIAVEEGFGEYGEADELFEKVAKEIAQLPLFKETIPQLVNIKLSKHAPEYGFENEEGELINNMVNEFKSKEVLLDELYKLTQIEEERELTESETKRYVEIVDYCHQNDIEIDFGINI